MSDESSRFTLDRRTFISSTSMALVAMATSPAFGATSAAAPALAVGFLGGVPTLARRTGGHRSIVAGESLTTSAPALAQSGARVGIRGLWQRPENRSRRGRYAVEVEYDTDAQAEKVPFYAWSRSVTDKGQMTSAPVSFLVPVTAGSPLELRFSRDFGSPYSAKIAFSVTSMPGAYMLDEGAYVLAFIEAGERLPDWSAIEFVPGATPLNFDGKDGLIRERSILGSTPVSFDYIVMTVGSYSSVRPPRHAIDRVEAVSNEP